MEYKIPLGVLLGRQFRIQRSALPEIEKWEAKIKKMISEGTANEKWASEIFILHMHCQSHKSPTEKSFDPSNNFVPFMNEWIKWLYIEPVADDHAERLIRRAIHISILTMPKELTLTDQLLENANINFNAKKALTSLEAEIETQIKEGKLTKDETVTKIKTFCRNNAASSGYYDHKGNISKIVSDWFDYVNEKQLVSSGCHDSEPLCDFSFLDEGNDSMILGF